MRSELTISRKQWVLTQNEDQKHCPSCLVGYTTFRSGRFGLGHFGQGTFRSEYEILQKSYTFTF